MTTGKYSGCCLRRFNSSIRCSSSKINSLFFSIAVDVLAERRVRLDIEQDRIARIPKRQIS